jgi:ribosomal protein S12 methylthiotransferase accessory factor YcaO
VPHNLLALCNGSTGLAAGNTIEEALTQGLSEICEHYVHY